MTEQTKKCPLCAENIPVTATVCPYCNTPLQNQAAAPAAAIPPSQQIAAPDIPPARRSRSAGVVIFGLVAIVAVLAGAAYYANQAGWIQLPLFAPTATRVNWECFTDEVAAYGETVNAINDRGMTVVESASNLILVGDYEEPVRVHAEAMWQVVREMQAMNPPHLFAEYHRLQSMMWLKYAETLDAIASHSEQSEGLMNEALLNNDAAIEEMNRIDAFCTSP